MKKRIHRRKIVHRIKKKDDQHWGVVWFIVLFALATAIFLVSRQSYLGQTLGTCSDPYNACPTSTSTPKPTTVTTPKPSSATTPSIGTTITPSAGTTISPSVSPNPSTSPILSPPITAGDTPEPSDETEFVPNPSGEGDGVESVPAIPSPRSFRSLISDPDTGDVTAQSLITAPAAMAAALYEVAYDNVTSQIDAFTNSVSHIESPAINRFRLPDQVCTFLGNVGMEWLCE